MTIAVTSVTTFTASYSLNRLDGVKDLDPRLRKPKELMTEEELWKKILEEPYEKPYCPHCHAELAILRIDVEFYPSTLPVFYFPSWNQTTTCPVVTYSPIEGGVDVWMYCEACHIRVLGKGRGLEFKGEKVYLQKLRLISTHPDYDNNYRPPPYDTFTPSINWTVTFT